MESVRTLLSDSINLRFLSAIGYAGSVGINVADMKQSLKDGVLIWSPKKF